MTGSAASIPGCAATSATLVLEGAPTTPAFHGQVAYDLDQGQYRVGDGPCLASHTTNTTVRKPPLTATNRQPTAIPRGNEPAMNHQRTTNEVQRQWRTIANNG